MDKGKPKGEKSQLIREGINLSNPSHREGLFASSSFIFKSAQEAKDLFSGEKKGLVYGRFSNPNVDLFERKMALLEGGERAVAFSSGMASLTSFLLAHLKQGDHIVASQDLFGSTFALLRDWVCKWGIETTLIEDFWQIENWQKAIKPNTKIFLTESPTNPLMKVLDIKKWSQLAQSENIITLLDNCIAPTAQKPLALGCNVVMHSTTKYIDGHGRFLGGVVIGSDELLEPAYQWLKISGACLSPFNAWNLSHSLDTLDLRFQKHCDNACKVARFLDQHLQIDRVYHPSLEGHQTHDIAKRQMNNFGAIISFEVKSSPSQACQRAFDVINHCHWFSLTANFGDERSTIIHPATTTHHKIGKETRQKVGIKDNLVRLSVGLENAEDIIKALDMALS